MVQPEGHPGDTDCHEGGDVDCEDIIRQLEIRLRSQVSNFNKTNKQYKVKFSLFCAPDKCCMDNCQSDS